jgi:hypothetical protein
MDNLPVPVGVFVFAGFGIVYGWILHSAVDRSVFKISGIRVFDSYFLSWLLGLVSAFTPMMFFVALGFHEFADTPDGTKLEHRLHWAGRLQLVYLVLYGVIVLATVPQRS